MFLSRYSVGDVIVGLRYGHATFLPSVATSFPADILL